MGKFNDLTNQRFGRLVVLYRTEDHISPSGKKMYIGIVNVIVVKKKILLLILYLVELQNLVVVYKKKLFLKKIVLI